MTPICRPRTKASAGFTLVEMLVVLTVLGIAAVIMASTLGREPGGLQRKRAALTLQNAILEAEREARGSGKAVTVAPEQLVGGATLSGVAFAEGEPPGALKLYPDGSASGGVVELEGRPLLNVDWLTGQVALHD